MADTKAIEELESFVKHLERQIAWDEACSPATKEGMYYYEGRIDGTRKALEGVKSVLKVLKDGGGDEN